MASDALLRIGELSRRTGVKPDLLRAWERRYGLLAPQRTSGGFRLYPLTDVERIEAMQSHMARGPDKSGSRWGSTYSEDLS